MTLRRLPSVLSVELPVLQPREAEALIDILEQIQGALWDTYGTAIVERASDEDPPAPDDDPPF